MAGRRRRWSTGFEPERGALLGIVTTVRAPVEQVLAFVAHHLGLGPARISVHLDDAGAEGAAVAAALAGIDRVEAVHCTRAYWRGLKGHRPKAHQYRQMLNATRVYAAGGVEWLLHIDVDEFLVADRPLAGVLAAATGRMVRVEPWEALHDPGAPEDIFTGRYFRRPALRGEAPALAAVLGPRAALLRGGMLGHAAGKCFFRTGVPGLQPSIHTARLEGRQIAAGPFVPGLALLHFHAEDPERWLARLAYRVEHGGYRANPALQAFLRGAAPAELSEFYLKTQVATPELVDGLGRLGMLREERLGLREKVAGLRG